MQLRERLGEKRTAQLSIAIRPVLRFVSNLPIASVRLLGLRIAGAKIGQDIVLLRSVKVISPWRLSLGSHNNIARNVQLDARGYLDIGDNVNISEEVAVWTAEHDVQCPTFSERRSRTVIGNRVWLGFRSVILPGVTIGEGSVVASGAVVTKSVPPFSIAAGVPAKIIGQRNSHLTYQLGRTAGPI